MPARSGAHRGARVSLLFYRDGAAGTTSCSSTFHFFGLSVFEAWKIAQHLVLTVSHTHQATWCSGVLRESFFRGRLQPRLAMESRGLKSWLRAD